MNIFNNVNLMDKAMDALWIRNQVINNNIANIDTPGFKRSEVVFEQLLDENKAKLKGKLTRDKHIPIGNRSINDIQPMIIKQDNTTMRMDENNVDIDYEMTELAKNTVQYTAVANQVSGYLSKIKNVITGG